MEKLAGKETHEGMKDIDRYNVHLHPVLSSYKTLEIVNKAMVTDS